MNERVALFMVGVLTAALTWCWMRRLFAWRRWNSSKREREAVAERSEMLRAAIRIVRDHWEMLAVGGARTVERLEKENTELQDKLKLATRDMRHKVPRNSCLTRWIQSAIEGLDKIDERIGKLDIGEENREELRYEVESLAEKLANILRESSGGSGGTACPDDSEDDFGAARALEPGSGATSATQAVDPVQGLNANATSPPPSNNGPPVRLPNRRKQTSRRRRSEDGGRER